MKTLYLHSDLYLAIFLSLLPPLARLQRTSFDYKSVSGDPGIRQA